MKSSGGTATAVKTILRPLLPLAWLLVACDDGMTDGEPRCVPLEGLEFASLTWLAYAPTGFDPGAGVFPSEARIRQDLELARDHGFDGVITFAADGTLGQVPRIAREVGFCGVVMGVFMFDSAQRVEEIANAKDAAEYVDAYGVGNEGLIGCGGDLYRDSVLVRVIDEIRAATGRPATTSEQVENYLDGCRNGLLLSTGDWLFPIVHPFNNGIRDPDEGVEFTEGRLRALADLTEKPVFAKETGWPTAGDTAATEENQERYFVRLKEGPASYAYFEAFDQPFKITFLLPWEPHWGLFRQDRTPKRFVRNHPP